MNYELMDVLQIKRETFFCFETVCHAVLIESLKEREPKRDSNALRKILAFMRLRLIKGGGGRGISIVFLRGEGGELSTN